MKKPRADSPTADELRHRAEDRLRAAPPGTARDEEAQRQLHELQVHQIELELQNEELLQSRAELEVSAERYADLYDFAPVSYLTLDLGGAICEANLTAATYLGVNRAQLIGQRFQRFLAAESSPLFGAFLEKTATGDTKETCEVTLPKADGPPRRAWLEGLALPAGSGAGRHCRLVVIDITDHSREAAENRHLLDEAERTRLSLLDIIEDLGRTEESLRESQAHLRFTLESARLGDWDLDLTADTARHSQRHDLCFGYTEPVAEWGFEKFIAHVHPEDRGRVRRDFLAATTGLQPWDFECRVVWPDGSTHWISAHGDIYRKDGKPTRMLGMVADITPRKEAEAAVEKKAAELRLMLKNMLNAFIVWESVFDENGKYVSFRFGYFNDAYLRIAGVSLEEVRGKDVFEVWPTTEQSWVDVYGEVAITGVPKAFDMYHAPTKGWYHCNAYRPTDSTAQVCVIFEDVTERKEAEMKIGAQLEELLRWQKVTVGREMRSQELKEEINQLLAAQGQPARYTGPRPPSVSDHAEERRE